LPHKKKTKSQEAHKYKYIKLKQTDKTIQKTKMARKTTALTEENKSLKDGEGRLTEHRVEQEILQSHN